MITINFYGLRSYSTRKLQELRIAIFLPKIFGKQAWSVLAR
jgi:hypothetical protein